MNEKELVERIESLKKDIRINEMTKSDGIMTIILKALAILAGGLVLGALFHQVALVIVAALFLEVTVLTPDIKEVSDLIEDIERCRHQVAVDGDELNKLKETKQQAKTNKARKEDEPIIITPKKKYDYKKASEKKKEPKGVLGKDYLLADDGRIIPIERFDESDFEEEPEENKPKRR